MFDDILGPRKKNVQEDVWEKKEENDCEKKIKIKYANPGEALAASSNSKPSKVQTMPANAQNPTTPTDPDDEDFEIEDLWDASVNNDEDGDEDEDEDEDEDDCNCNGQGACDNCGCHGC